MMMMMMMMDSAAAAAAAAAMMIEEEEIIDMDYEYDACMFFDFCRPESLCQSRQAELWFLSAKSYPPSPFVQPTIFNQQQQQQPASLLHINKTKPKNTNTVSSRISPFMTPTATLNNSCIPLAGIENQAPKRQKLDGGHLRKVPHIKQQTTFLHKNQTTHANSTNASKLKLTIPREPQLVTAHRAHRIIRSKDISQGEEVSLTTHRFRARPFNKKIFETPSMPVPKKTTQRVPEFQAFHLKTSERATRHSSAVLSSSSSFHDNDSDMGLLKARTNLIEENRRKDFTRQTSVGAPKQDGCKPTHTFKARPLNEKIFSSKGDIGVFRNTKRENTVPKEFNFHTEKRTQQDPPTELFSKLSLLSKANLTNGTQLRRPQPTHFSLQDSKENRFGVSNQEKRMHSVKERPRFYTGQTNYGMSRGLGIR